MLAAIIRTEAPSQEERGSRWSVCSKWAGTDDSDGRHPDDRLVCTTPEGRRLIAGPLAWSVIQSATRIRGTRKSARRPTQASSIGR
jgi:hypothetical protein